MRRLYTRKGDDGFTFLIGKARVPKYHPQAEAIGTIDEASAVLGIARASSQDDLIVQIVIKIQRDLYELMSELAASSENAEQKRVIDGERINWLEAQIEGLVDEIEIPNGFIVPGDSPVGATFSFARTVIRRAERTIAHLLHDGIIGNKELLRYMNRLSSLCFVLELWENQNWGKGTSTLAKKE